jgi:hypothetical protein
MIFALYSATSLQAHAVPTAKRFISTTASCGSLKIRPYKGLKTLNHLKNHIYLTKIAMIQNIFRISD